MEPRLGVDRAWTGAVVVAAGRLLVEPEAFDLTITKPVLLGTYTVFGSAARRTMTLMGFATNSSD